MSCYQNFRFAACFAYETITQAIESSVSWVNTETFKLFLSVAVRFVTNRLSLQLHWNLIRSHLNLFVLPVQPCGPPKLFCTCVGKHALRRLTTSNRCGKSCSLMSKTPLSLEMECFNFFAPFLHAFIKDKMELTPRAPRNVTYTLFSRLCD